MTSVVRALVLAGAVLAVSAAPVAASHTHVMAVGNGRCVVLAEGSGEEGVVLPLSVFENNPNVTIAPTSGPMHPLHVLVHKGVPGTHNDLQVAGSPGDRAMCSAGYVNR